MKMSLWTVLWGSFFILIGLSIFLKAFGVDLPVFRVLFALFIIWVGLSILLPGRSFFTWCNITTKTGRETVFGESKISGSDVAGDYKVVFGSNEMDLTQAFSGDKTKDVHVQVVFGNSKIKVDKTHPLKLTGETAFGEIRAPNGNSGAFGRLDYASESYKADAPHLNLNVHAVFGSVEIE